MSGDAAVVVVAVDAGKEITDSALEWTVRNVVQPADTLILLALIKSFPNSGKHLQAHGSFNRYKQPSLLTSLLKWSQRTGRLKKGLKNVDEAAIKRINDVCGEMMKELCWVNNLKGVKTHVVVTAIPGAHVGYVADKAEEYRANWLILDRRLKKETESCLKQLPDSNIILIDHAIPKILQMIEAATEEESNNNYTVSFPDDQSNCSVTDDTTSTTSGSSFTISGPLRSTTETDTSKSTLMLTRAGYDSDSESKPAPMLRMEDYLRSPPSPSIHQNSSASKERGLSPLGRHVADSRSSNLLGKKLPTSRKVFDDVSSTSWSPDSTISNTSTTNRKGINIPIVPRAIIETSDYSRSAPSDYAKSDAMTELSISEWMFGKHPIATRGNARGPSALGRRLDDSRSTLNQRTPTTFPAINRISSVRRAMSLSIKQPPPPPPLCSVCRHSAPKLGKPPRKFTYEEVERATQGFAKENFLAEGGYGMVYKGVLEDGQLVAVKQHKKVSAQGAAEFCSEVEVLSCAQHRNLVMLVGYCMEKEWLLIYEFVCNGSVDKHLQGNDKNEVMAWDNRQKVAVGAARALRYLHEDCRVGCIIHRDFRPNNILLTHDFEPMVGDFGLARWQEDGQKAEETRIVGTFGYLAPEYTQTGQITEKADVYAFGVLLMELITGVKAIDLARCTGQQTLPQWVSTLIDKNLMNGLLDPMLDENYDEQEVETMLYVASICISPHPELRPRMSKVLRMLEGDMPSEGVAHRQLQMPVNSVPPLRATFEPVEFFRAQVDKTIYNTLYEYSNDPFFDELMHKRGSRMAEGRNMQRRM